MKCNLLLPHPGLIATLGSAMIALGASTVDVHALSPEDRLPMDPIPAVTTIPDPCDNPTTRRWGPNDELGNLNFLTPEKVSENLGLIRLGKVYNLAHVLEVGQMGFWAFLDFKSNLGDWPGRGVERSIFNNEETLGNSTYNPGRAGVLQFEIGTQLDGFNHATQSGIAYNCFDTRDPENHLLPEGDSGDLPKGNPGDDYLFRGHKKLGIQNVGTIVARAVLIDVGRLLRERETDAGRDPELFPPADYEFSPEELELALLRQGLTIDDIHPGDALLIRTAWAARYWTANPADPRNERLKYLNIGQDEEFQPGSPGLGARAVQWTLNRDPVLVSADTKSIEISNPLAAPRDPAFAEPGHASWLNSGIYMLEDVDLEMLASDCEQERVQNIAEDGRTESLNASCYVSTLIVPTIPIMGSGGSTVAPVIFR
jgi:hypothetical protein